MFRFIQKYLIGFNLRLWPGHSKTFTEMSLNNSCCVFRVQGSLLFVTYTIIQSIISSEMQVELKKNTA